MNVIDAYHIKQPVISMEFFPYRDEKTMGNFKTTLADLVPLDPDYLSVTFGAGGSTKDGSFQTVQTILQNTQIPCVAYIAGYGLSPSDITDVLDRYRELGIDTIFVIRGDQPKQEGFIPHPDSFSYASDLIAFIRDKYDFTLGCAGYPEGHIEAESLDRDIMYLKQKVDSGAQYVVAQYFYDNDYFFTYVDKCRKAGINVPIIPGIMPVYTAKMTQILSKVCGTTITGKLQEKLDTVDANDPAAVLNTGIDFAVEQCEDLLKKKVAGLHFYTMNRSRSTREIITRLKQKQLL